jgi:hypothetical protein
MTTRGGEDRGPERANIRTFPFQGDHLYRYCDMKGIDVFSSLRLKVTPPDQFNDPFEFLLNVDSQHTIADMQKMLSSEEWTKKYWAEEDIVHTRWQTYEAFRERYLKEVRGNDSLASGAFRAWQKFIEGTKGATISFFCKELGFVCYSEISDDILMWAHYAQGHRGFVIEFDVNHPFFSDNPNIMPVEYSTERARAVFHEELDFGNDPLPLARRKCPHWSYEKEWRQMYWLADCVPVERDGRTTYYVPIPASCISSVIIGLRCDEQDVRDIKKALAYGLQHVKVKQATLHPSEFRLVI